MYLSQLILNPRSRQVRSELARLYELHRTVMSGFAPKPLDERVLFRLDLSTKEGIPKLLVQSHSQPDWSKLQAKDGYFLEEPQVQEYNPQFQTGQRLVFRLLANPTRSNKEGVEPGERGKRETIGRHEDQAAWLNRKGENGGFRVSILRITSIGEQRLAIPDRETKETHAARHWAVRFDGELEVTDQDTFLATVQKGIGSAKGFGFGLLSVLPT